MQAGPEGAADDGKRDMFEGQEEARRSLRARLGRPWPRLTGTRPCRAAQERKAWWPRLKDYMGKDIMSLMSVPVFIMVKP